MNSTIAPIPIEGDLCLCAQGDTILVANFLLGTQTLKLRLSKDRGNNFVTLPLVPGMTLSMLFGGKHRKTFRGAVSTDEKIIIISIKNDPYYASESQPPAIYLLCDVGKGWVKCNVPSLDTIQGINIQGDAVVVWGFAERTEQGNEYPIYKSKDLCKSWDKVIQAGCLINWSNVDCDIYYGTNWMYRQGHFLALPQSIGDISSNYALYGECLYVDLLDGSLQTHLLPLHLLPKHPFSEESKLAIAKNYMIVRSYLGTSNQYGPQYGLFMYPYTIPETESQEKKEQSIPLSDNSRQGCAGDDLGARSQLAVTQSRLNTTIDDFSMLSSAPSIFGEGDFQEKCILIAETVDRDNKLSTTHKMWIARQRKNAEAGKLNPDDASFLEDLIESLGLR